jgi:hypothetical protein
MMSLVLWYEKGDRVYSDRLSLSKLSLDHLGSLKEVCWSDGADTWQGAGVAGDVDY